MTIKEEILGIIDRYLGDNTLHEDIEPPIPTREQARQRREETKRKMEYQEALIKVDAKNRILIPKEIRETTKIKPGNIVLVSVFPGNKKEIVITLK